MKIIVNGKDTSYFGQILIQACVKSLVDMAVLTFQNSAQARNTFTPGAKCSISSDDGAVNYITGIVECANPKADGTMVVTVMDSLWPALKYTAQGKLEFANTTTRNLISQLLSPFSITATGSAGVLHKKAILNADELLMDAIYRYADRAGVFVMANESGQAELRTIGDDSGITLDQKTNIFEWDREWHYMPPNTRILTTESNDFDAYAQASGTSSYFEAQIVAGALSMEEAANRAKIINWRVRGNNDCLTAKVDPRISLLPGKAVNVQCVSAGITETRIVRQLTILMDARTKTIEKTLELVPTL